MGDAGPSPARCIALDQAEGDSYYALERSPLWTP